MKVRDLCVCNAGACTPESSLARAGALLRRYAVGSLPVVDREDRVIGIVTDRDLLLETVHRNAPPSEILVDSVMSDRPALCSPEDDILDCLTVMRRNRVRRLPVVDEDDRLEGVISIDDIICHAADQRGDEEIPRSILIDTLCEISRAYQAESGHRGLPRETSTDARGRLTRDRSRSDDREEDDEPLGRGRRLRPEPGPERRAKILRPR